MRELMERGLLVGIGAMTLTREKAEAFVDELIIRGQARRGEAGGLVDKLVEQGEEERDELRKLVRSEIESSVARMKLATRKDLEVLSQKIEELAEKLER